ncbi:MAG: RHS repeat-associated core domain-containing protein [Rhodanobacter sp.]
MILRARWAIILALWLLAGVAQAGTKHYYYTDPQGTVLAKTDAQGNIVATYDYAPYGKQVLGTTQSGPTGYTGHVNDAESGLVYMQARYYDPVMARFVSVDPKTPAAGNTFNFNRYAYANNNPIVNIDPDGRTCTTSNGMVTCMPTLNGQRLSQLPQVTFPAPANWPSTMDSSSSGHHEYIYSNPIGNKSEANVAQAIAQNPTPNANDHPATAQGTSNSAAPSTGARSVLAGISALAPAALGGGDSQVTSYAFKDSKGSTWTVNVTQGSHTLSPGYVLRGAVQGDAISYGEGTALKQNLGRASELLLNDVWIDQNQKNINDAN